MDDNSVSELIDVKDYKYDGKRVLQKPARKQPGLLKFDTDNLDQSALPDSKITQPTMMEIKTEMRLDQSREEPSIQL
jgi:hypothetical protein